MDAVKFENNKFNIFDDVYLYFQEAIENFDLSKLVILPENTDNYFQCFYSYSYDKLNYADFKIKSEYVGPEIDMAVYPAIFFKKVVLNDLQKPLTIYQTQNVESVHHYFELESIKYNNKLFDLTSELIVKFQGISKLINEFPRWNFYDGKNVSIDRWIKQCNAISEMYGHTCIYFKTEPVESEIVHTFKNNVIRNVVSIKKLHILAPNNELPQDRNVYSDWDMPLQDDFIIHVVKDKFEQAFGLDTIPVEKDYLYLPIINKLFRIAASQPKNGFMGKIGWWEVFLGKFEDDECVTMDEGLKTSMEGFSDFDLAIDSINLVDNSLQSQIFNELSEFKDDTVQTKEKIDLVTVEEKKSSNQNYTNKLVDSTGYIALKETEKLREFFNSRLQIISVNPDTSAFPITMYDNSTVEKRTVGIQYVLNDFTIKNKFGLTVTKNFQLSFNFVLTTKFVGEVYDILNGNLSLFTLNLNRNKFEILDNNRNLTYLVDFPLVINEFYNIVLSYDLTLNQFAIKIFSIVNKEKSLNFQNIYINNDENNVSFSLTNLQLFGGKFYSNEIIFKIDEKIILQDYVNPVLIMKQ